MNRTMPPFPLQGVSNRDLKLENLMLCRNGGPEAQAAERPLLKIGDFGCAAFAWPCLHAPARGAVALQFAVFANSCCSRWGTLSARLARLPGRRA